METNKTVKKLFAELERTGRTRRWASNILGISESTISRWESRGSDPHPFVMDRINKMIAKMEKEQK